MDEQEAQLEETLRRLCGTGKNVRSVALLVDRYQGDPVIMWTNECGAIPHTHYRHLRGMMRACWAFISYLTTLAGKYCIEQSLKIEQCNQRLDTAQQLVSAMEPNNVEKVTTKIPLTDT